MSDDPQQQNITQIEFEAFISAKMPDLTCHGCGQDKFSTLVSQDVVNSARVHWMIGATVYMPILVRICDNCGYSIPVFWKTVHDWVVARNNEGLEDAT